MIFIFLSCEPSKTPATDTSISDTAIEEQWVRDPMFDDLASTLEAEFNALGAERAAFALFTSSEIVYAEGFGSEPDGREIVPETNFRIGSVTKMISAIGLLQELDNNGISIDDKYTTINPDFTISATAEFAADITFKDMLQHSTGILDSISIEGSTSDSALGEFVNTTMSSQYYQMNPAGLFYNYSNPNYSLAGYASESLSGKNYVDKISEDVLTPLGMTRSTFLSEDIIADGNYATGVSNGSNGYDLGTLLPPDQYDNGWARPAGYMWSNTIDLAALAMFFMNGESSILSDEQRQAMISPQISTNILGDYSHYGLGWAVETGFWPSTGYIEIDYIHHSGAIPGYSTTLLICPEKDIGFVALAATDGAYINTSMFEALALYGLPEATDFPPEIYFDIDDLDSFAGAYSDAFNIGDVIITNDNGTLRIDAPTLEEYDVPYETTLSPYTKDTVIWDVQGYPFTMSFIRDDSGTPQYFANRYFVATRTEETSRSSHRTLAVPNIPRPTPEPAFTRPALP